jgi:hypothetical protein
MADVCGGDHCFVTRASHCIGLCGEDHISVQRRITGRLPAHLSGGCPKLGRLQHHLTCDRGISEHALQRIQTTQTLDLARPNQLAAHFIISDLGNLDLDAVVGKIRQPILALLIFGGAFRIRDHAKRTGVQQDDHAHEKSR